MKNKFKHSLTLTDETDFDNIVKSLQSSGIGFLAIVDGAGKLVGIVTDSDIRNAALTREFNINKVINRKPHVLSSDSPRLKVINTLKNIHRRHMPLIDENGLYQGVVSLDDLEFNVKSNKVVIMAGGLGSRLGKLTENVPKPMLPVAGKPMLEHLVNRFSNNGFLNFVFCINYKKEVIKDYFGDGSKFGVTIEYVEENKKLGTAGALSLSRDLLTEPFFVINADVITDLDFSKLLKFHEDSNADGTICVREYDYQIPFGVVNILDNGNITSLVEKPVYSYSINAGIYIINPEIVKYIPENQYTDMPNLLNEMHDKGLNLKSFALSDYWLDVGRPDDYQKANKDFEA